MTSAKNPTSFSGGSVKMRKNCNNCHKKTMVIFDALLNKDVCGICKTPFPVKIVTRNLQVGDKVTRKEYMLTKDAWELPEGVILTIRKLSDDETIVWFEELEHNGRKFFEEDKNLQFWEKKNFELVEQNDKEEN